MNENKSILAGIAMGCLTLVACMFLMTRCTMAGNEEFTKRQQIAAGTTNQVLEAYDPLIMNRNAKP